MQTIVFGGAFDPPHHEHKRICTHAVRACGAKKLVLVPTSNPPHKHGAIVDFSIRVEMINALFSDCDYEIEISQIENENKDTPNYSSNTLKILAKKYENPAFLIGADSLLAFDTWHKPDEILATMPILVAGREGFFDLQQKADELMKKYGGKIVLLDTVGNEVSSSTIKAKLFLGLDISLDKGVKEVIFKNNLFQDYREILQKLKNRQSPELFFHSIAVCLRAVDINARMKLGLDFEEVFLSALLHDNAKEMLEAGTMNVPKEAIGTPVLHQFLGAERAKTDFGIDNPKILDAIRFHTTAKANMSTLEKLIYSSDMLSEDRDFDGISILLKQIYSDFEKGFFACLEHSYHHVLSKRKKMYPLTEQAYEFYSKQFANTNKLE